MDLDWKLIKYESAVRYHEFGDPTSFAVGGTSFPHPKGNEVLVEMLLQRFIRQSWFDQRFLW